MAGDDSDLTFIRCPGCRSLVPAVATRCRMCGQLLEGKTTSPDDTGSQKSRVRQRTMSVNDEERDSVKEQFVPKKIEQPEEDEDDVPLFPESPSKNGSKNGELPEAVRAFAHADEQSRGPKQRATVLFDARELEHDDAEEDHDDDDQEDEESGADGPLSASPEEGGKKRRRRRRRKKKGPELGVTDTRSFTNPGSSPAAPAPSAASHAVPWRKSDAAPVVTAADTGGDTLGHTSGANSGASYAEPSEPPPPYRAPAPERRPAAQSESVAPAAQATPSRSAPSRVAEPVEHRPGTRSPLDAPPVQTPESGALCGWLVIFGLDGQATSRELRSGRFFVSREKLRPTDIVFDHPSISRPHGLLVASPKDGVHVQDLMSEHGTQVKRSGKSTFEAVSDSGTTRVYHGDILRLGHFEILICLLPS